MMILTQLEPFTSYISIRFTPPPQMAHRAWKIGRLKIPKLKAQQRVSTLALRE